MRVWKGKPSKRLVPVFERYGSHWKMSRKLTSLGDTVSNGLS